MKRNTTYRSCDPGLPRIRARAGRSAVLVDLENIARAGGDWLPDDETGLVLRRALYLAGPAEFRIAIAPAGVLRRYAGTLDSLHLPCESVPAGPDAADLALLAHARHLTRVGYRWFTVLSGDHIFAELSRQHPTTVIVRRGQSVARVLRQTAIAVLAA